MMVCLQRVAWLIALYLNKNIALTYSFADNSMEGFVLSTTLPIKS